MKTTVNFGMGSDINIFITRNWISIILFSPRYWKPLEFARPWNVLLSGAKHNIISFMFHKYWNDIKSLLQRPTSIRMERYFTWCWLNICIKMIFSNFLFYVDTVMFCSIIYWIKMLKCIFRIYVYVFHQMSTIFDTSLHKMSMTGLFYWFIAFFMLPRFAFFSYWFRAVIRVFMHYPNVANIFVSNHFTLINVLRLRILHCYIPPPHFLLSVVNGSTLVQNHNLPMFHTFRYSNEVCDLKRHLFQIRCLYDSSFHENWCLVTTLLAMV